MIKPLALETLSKHFGGEALGPKILFTSVSTDTRMLSKGDLFVALVGEHFDGHDYLDQALLKGAVGLVISNSCRNRLPLETDLSVWLVEDTTLALGHIGSYQRSHFRHPLVAITGSSGKTSVKEMLAEILRFYVGPERVFASQGNFNNHIGVPLSLLQLNPVHEFAVIEMGASALGEIAYLTQMAKPAVALVNNVMAAHVEGFGSLDAISKAKGEIYLGLEKTGIAIINADDFYASQWLQQNQGRKRIIYSVADQCSLDSEITCKVYAKSINRLQNGCYSFCLVCGDQSVVVELAVLGKHNVANGVAAAACAFALGVDVKTIRKGLEHFSGKSGRLQVLTGYNQCTLIDDSYNANPGSMRAAIDVLAEIPGRTILVVGDMKELGSESDKQHKSIGQYAAEKKLDCVFSLGEKSALISATFLKKPTINSPNIARPLRN